MSKGRMYPLNFFVRIQPWVFDIVVDVDNDIHNEVDFDYDVATKKKD